MTIDALSHEGEGIGRHEGMAVFVPRAAIGDKLRAKVVKVLKNRAYAIQEELLEPSPNREENHCPAYRRCGGCTLRHIAYSHELKVKHGWVADNLRRIGGLTPAMDPIIPSPAVDRYRNKAQFPVAEVEGIPQVGLFSSRTHTLIPVADCLLQPLAFRDISRALLEHMEEHQIPAYSEATHSGLVRHLYIRQAQVTGQMMVCLVINGDSLPQQESLTHRLRQACPGLTTLVLSVNRARTNVILGKKLQVLLGDGYIQDVLCGVRVRLSPLSFYQVNHAAAQLLYNAALDYARPQPEELLLDLYCGAGTIGLSMAHRVRQVVGVETVPQAVEDARHNAATNNIRNARFLCADAAAAAQKLEQEGLRPDIVVLDPPRKGLGSGLIPIIAAMAPKRIVYISCNSATLARDCKELAATGYTLTKARAVDLFPRTAHVEAVALLEQNR